MTQHINISAAKHKNSHTGGINEDYKLLVQGKLCNQQFMLGQDFCQNCGNLKQVENTVLQKTLETCYEKPEPSGHPLLVPIPPVQSLVTKFYSKKKKLFLTVPRSLWDLSSLTRDQTWALSHESVESYPLDSLRIP